MKGLLVYFTVLFFQISCWGRWTQYRVKRMLKMTLRAVVRRRYNANTR